MRSPGIPPWSLFQKEWRPSCLVRWHSRTFFSSDWPPVWGLSISVWGYWLAWVGKKNLVTIRSASWSVSVCCLHVQAWAVFGAQRDFSGVFRGSSPHRWATLAAPRPTQIITKSVQVKKQKNKTHSARCIFDNGASQPPPPWGGELGAGGGGGLRSLFDRSVGVQESRRCRGEMKKRKGHF